MKTRGILLIIVTLCLSLIAPSSLASDRDVHDAYMLNVLFGNDFKEERYNTKELAAIEALEAASYLAVDQYNAASTGNGIKELNLLSGYRVPSIPSDISEIDFPGNQHHRRYTHRRWMGPYNNAERPYQDDKAHWNLRKTILIETVKKVFGLKDDSARVCESLSAVIYYIHVLGDHIVETDYQKMNADLIGVGGRNDQYDIIHQLIYHFDILFISPSSSNRYNSFRSQLRLLNNEFSELVNKDGGVNTPEKQATYSRLAKKLMYLLIKHVPGLLQEESYFSKVFPAR